jgi:hypothetical protein
VCAKRSCWLNDQRVCALVLPDGTACSRSGISWGAIHNAVVNMKARGIRSGRPPSRLAVLRSLRICCGNGRLGDDARGLERN